MTKNLISSFSFNLVLIFYSYRILLSEIMINLIFYSLMNYHEKRLLNSLNHLAKNFIFGSISRDFDYFIKWTEDYFTDCSFKRFIVKDNYLV